MIVVAIIAILAAIALPAYQNYVARSQVTSGLADIRGGVTAFEEGIQNPRPGQTVDLPTMGLAATTPRCSALGVGGTYSAGSGQSITCTLAGNPQVVGKVARNSSGQWVCTVTGGLDARFLPGGCT